MRSATGFMTGALALAGVSCSMPSSSRLSASQLRYHDIARRQNDAAAAMGLNDFDILEFALTLENLEEAFYRQAFALFDDQAFADLGLLPNQLDDMKQIGKTESQHVGFLQSALAQNGIAPVQLCEYDFSPFFDLGPAGVVAAAAILENVGLSAYLGAAPLLADPALLGAAASILTVESRHQTAIRVFASASSPAGVVAVPQPFDSPLGPRSVFSVAAPLIKSCPDGSNLAIEAFPALTLSQDGADLAIGGQLLVQVNLKAASDAAAQATHCAFTSGAVLPGGTKFSPFTEADGCLVPKDIAGITYVSLTNAGPLEGVITDDMIMAGPAVVTIS